mgnify:CR=1 FL=1
MAITKEWSFPKILGDDIDGKTDVVTELHFRCYAEDDATSPPIQGKPIIAKIEYDAPGEPFSEWPIPEAELRKWCDAHSIAETGLTVEERAEDALDRAKAPPPKELALNPSKE